VTKNLKFVFYSFREK